MAEPYTLHRAAQLLVANAKLSGRCPQPHSGAGIMCSWTQGVSTSERGTGSLQRLVEPSTGFEIRRRILEDYYRHEREARTRAFT